MFGRRKRDYEDGLRERARELRRAGLTYSEIREALTVTNVPRSQFQKPAIKKASG